MLPAPSAFDCLPSLEAQRIGTHPGDQRLRQSISLAVSRKATARANWARR
jgi:hypothetical protein